MAKNKVSEWSSTPANNTDVGGIDIAEGCAPSGINNAIREMMAQLKDQQSGTDADSFTVGGTLSVTGTSSFTGAITATGGVVGALTGNASTATSSNAIANTGGWAVTPTSTTLYFSYNGTNVAKLDSSGNLTVKANVTAYGTI